MTGTEREGLTMRSTSLAAVFLALLLGLSPPALAEEPAPDLRRGLELLDEGARRLLDGLRGEIEPFLSNEVLPLLERLGALIDDLSHYELPERLPNGDILIRRAPDAPPLPDPAPDTNIPPEPVEI
jgi:hypothetical protein